MDSWMDPPGRRLPIIVRANSIMLGNPIRIRIDSDEAEHDMRMYVHRERGGPATGSIDVYHPTPAIPHSLTPTGTSIVYILREQLSRSPPPMQVSDMNASLEYHSYFSFLRHRFYRAMQNLIRADAELERGRELQPGPTGGRLDVSESERRSIALNIVWGLRLLQTRTRRSTPNCLLCSRRPASRREPEASPAEGSVETNTLGVRSRKFYSFGRFTVSEDIDDVSILPPTREGTADVQSTQMLCGLHRYVFQYLMYQVVSPSWPVPHLLGDMATFGEVGVARWNPVARIWQFQEPRG